MRHPRYLKVTVVLFLTSYVCLQMTVIQSPGRPPPVSGVPWLQELRTPRNIANLSVEDSENKVLTASLDKLATTINKTLIQKTIIVNETLIQKTIMGSKTPIQNTITGNKTLIQKTITVNKTPIQQSRCGDSVRLLQGYQRQHRGFLTIGMSTVPRQNASYLEETLHALISGSSDSERENMVIVIFLGHHNDTWSSAIQEMMEDNFRDNLEKGELQVVQPDMSIYPNFSLLQKRTYNDSFKRVHWRTKQNIDFAYLFGYSDGMAEYYLHIEDDVIASENYIPEIKRYLSRHKLIDNLWFVLEFGTGFYGKLFRSRDLCMLKSTFLLFKDDKPCDLLLSDLKEIKLHDSKRVKVGKKLFKHMGKYSSLEGKIVTEKHVQAKKKPNRKPNKKPPKEMYVSNSTTNPDALIETSMEAYSTFTPELAYETNNNVYFWAYTPKPGDFYRVKLKSLVNTTRVAVRTGQPVTGADELENAVIFTNRELAKNGTCRSPVPLGNLTSGNFEHVFAEAEELMCLEIVVQLSQKNWVVIAQIEIET